MAEVKIAGLWDRRLFFVVPEILAVDVEFVPVSYALATGARVMC